MSLEDTANVTITFIHDVGEATPVVKGITKIFSKRLRKKAIIRIVNKGMVELHTASDILCNPDCQQALIGVDQFEPLKDMFDA